MLSRPELFTQGYHIARVALPETLRSAVHQENWIELDKLMSELLSKDGQLRLLLLEYHQFSEIEFIISIRDSSSEWEEDGIWHDDGSRSLAFSLSLTSEKIEGGRLGIRRKGEEEMVEIPTPDYGSICIFLTGIYGFEHKIHRVTKGKRVIIAGWCT